VITVRMQLKKSDAAFMEKFLGIVASGSFFTIGLHGRWHFAEA